MNEIHIKKLNIHNWLEQDKAISSIQRIQPNGKTCPITSSEWFEEIQKPALEDFVPEKIRKLFEVVQGTMTYGIFFYPILTSSLEQLTRIAEAAIALKCETINCPKSKNTFDKRIKWLMQESIIDDDSCKKWNSTRLLRNEFSHPTRQNIIDIETIIGTMVAIVFNINSLFETH